MYIPKFTGGYYEKVRTINARGYVYLHFYSG